MQRLNTLKSKHPIIDHVRGIGLMIGIQLNVEGGAIVSRCLEKGLRINCTQGTVLRFMPSMTVSQDELDQAIDILEQVLGEGEE